MGGALGPRQWVQLESASTEPGCHLLSFFCPSLCFAVRRTVFQAQISDLGPRSTPSSEWVFRNNGLFFFIIIIVVVVVIIVIIIITI